jgi:hypothetical protein
MSTEGSLYCLHNPAFAQYGKHYYKLGRTKNLRKRLYTYQTSYIEPSLYVAISIRRFRSSEDAEALLFYLLRRYRVRGNREFFHVPLPQVRHMMIRVSSISDDRIAKIADIVRSRIHIDKYRENEDIDDLIERMEGCCKADITRQPHWREELATFLDEYFEKFRFKPKQEDIEMYQKYGYKPPEDVEMNSLLDSTSTGEA